MAGVAACALPLGRREACCWQMERTGIRVHDPECNTVCMAFTVRVYIIVCMKSAPRELGEGIEKV
jgi:hypothetical protein